MKKTITSLLVVKILFLFAGGGVEAQYFNNDDICAMVADESELMSFSYAEKRFPVEGDVNALFIFVQHKNDVFEACKQFEGFDSESGLPLISADTTYSICQNRPILESTSCIPGHTLNRLADDKFGLQSSTDDPLTEWPHNLPAGPDSLHTKLLPCWATDIIDPPLSSQITEGSMTDLYRRVSNGKLNFRGHVWPYTYIPEYNWDHYRDYTDPNIFPNGMVRLSHEIISYVNQNPHGLDFTADYWDNYTNGQGDTVGEPDGVFDMIVLVYRFSNLKSITNIDGSAIASLGVNSTVGNSFSNAGGLQLGDFDVIDNTHSGSGVISQAQSKIAALRITAHEIGHRHFGLNHTQNGIGSNTRPVDHFSIMNGAPHLSFSALDRIRLGWANVHYKNINEITQSSYLTFTLRDAHQPNINGDYDALWLMQGEVPAIGDVVVELRLGNAVIERSPDGIHADGDMSDYFLPNPGLYLYKPSPSLARTNSYSLLNGGHKHPIGSFNIRRKFFGTPETDHQGFGTDDAYTPFTLINYDLPATHRTDIDLKLALTDFQETYDSFAEFRVWPNFLHANTTKELPSYYTFEDNSIGDTNSWKLGGSFRLLGSINSDDFILGSDSYWGGLEILSNEVELTNGSFLNINSGYGLAISSTKSSSTRPILSNSLIETGVHIYGSHTEAKLIGNVIINDGLGSVYVSGGAHAYIHDNDLISTSTGFSFNNYANVSASGATASFSKPFPTFQQGENRLSGGDYGLSANGSSATIYAGTSSFYRFNSFCDEQITLRAINNGTVLASNNYWSDPSPLTEVSNGGTVVITNNLGSPIDCTGILSLAATGNYDLSETVLNASVMRQYKHKSHELDEPLNRLYEAMDYRAENRYSEAFSLIKEIIKLEEHPYFGIAVKELLLLAPYIEKEEVLSILNSYYEGGDPSFAKMVTTNLALYHARNYSYDISLSIHQALDNYEMENSERFSTHLQHFYLAIDARYLDIAMATISSMAPSNEMEEWEMHRATEILAGQQFGDGNLNKHSNRRGIKQPNLIKTKIVAVNYPNPFNPSTTIQYTLQESAMISLEVFDILGRRVALLVNSTQEEGTHRAVFDASRMATGMYLYRLSANGKPALTNTMLLIK
ncbi:MAG: T9SS type A sorting domain-containing protein [Balneolales bacterium]|nr:T9SS type A sorting domain-containing protein [Balneolales bacterium]